VPRENANQIGCKLLQTRPAPARAARLRQATRLPNVGRLASGGLLARCKGRCEPCGSPAAARPVGLLPHAVACLPSWALAKCALAAGAAYSLARDKRQEQQNFRNFNPSSKPNKF